MEKNPNEIRFQQLCSDMHMTEGEQDKGYKTRGGEGEGGRGGGEGK